MRLPKDESDIDNAPNPQGELARSPRSVYTGPLTLYQSDFATGESGEGFRQNPFPAMLRYYYYYFYFN
jgi:hypothetical protein